MNIETVRTFSPLQGMPIPAGAASAEAPEAAQSASAPSARGVTVGYAAGGLGAIEGGDEVPESALRRDDALGKLVTSAFSMAVPPAPVFTDGGKDT